MEARQFLYAANWKMNFSFEQAVTFAQRHKDGFEKLANRDDASVVLCPSFDALYSAATLFKNSSVTIGAQTCSAHVSGAHTGQVSAASLAQIGCTHCIVGHSEVRAVGGTDADVAQKITRLLESGLIPIVCVGESRSEYEQEKTEEIIEKQVTALCQAVQTTKPDAHICVAYEPIWAIGTGDVPSNEHVEAVFEQITKIAKEQVPLAQIRLLYGGSVNDDNAAELKKIREIGGFLIGGASLDFQKFEKIVT